MINNINKKVSLRDCLQITCILFGQPQELKEQSGQIADITILDLSKRCLKSQEFSDLILEVSETRTLPHYDYDSKINYQNAKLWVEDLSGREIKSAFPINWWAVISAFFDILGTDVACDLKIGDTNISEFFKEIVNELIVSISNEQIVTQRLGKSSFFSRSQYISIHHDVAVSKIDPVEHYVKWGRLEGRALFDERFGSALIGSIDKSYYISSRKYLENYEKISHNDVPKSKTNNKVDIYVHSRGNYFMRPIAEATKNALESVGVITNIKTELEGPPKYIDTINIVVAPHEFFLLPIPYFFNEDRFKKLSVMFNTEQVPSKYFSLAMREISVARAVIDINFHTAKLLENSLPACFFMPPVEDDFLIEIKKSIDFNHPLFKSLDQNKIIPCDHNSLLQDRPLDIFFAGFANAYRDSFFVREAKYLAKKECFFAYTRLMGKPAEGGMWGETLFNNNALVTAASKIVLAIHRYPTGYMEWERMIMQGFSSGTCILATPGIQSPMFKPDLHYFEMPIRHFGLKLRYLLETKDGMIEAQRVATDGRKQMKKYLTYKKSGRFLINFLDSI